MKRLRQWKGPGQFGPGFANEMAMETMHPARMFRREFLRIAGIAFIPGAITMAAASRAHGSNLVCTICEQALRGTYSQYTLDNGRNYLVCQSCANSRPRCHSCNVPGRPEWLPAYPDRTRWCSACRRQTDLCNTCRSPILGRYYKLEFREGAWCARCYEGSPKCDLCREPMSQRHASLPDGRHICQSCSADTVRGTENFLRIYREVRPTIVEFLARDFTDVPIRAADLNQIEQVLAEARAYGASVPPRRMQGDRRVNELGLFRIFRGEPLILILDAIPVDLAYETVAHEMAHAWQTEHFPDVTEPVLIEGFAQWVAEHVCYRHHRRSGLVKLRERDDLYGHGFRVVRNVENRFGRDGVLELLRRNRLPPGSEY